MLAALLTPEEVLANYAEALAHVRAPAAYTCEYNVVDRGPRPQESTHRIFREQGRERDEMSEFNGQAFGHPEVRIFSRRVDPYAVNLLAPKPSAYVFTYVGVAHSGRNVSYVFNAFARGTQNYEVTRVSIDGATFLPNSIEFNTHGKAEGTGAVTYRKVDRFWMPQMATARAQVEGNLETEQIVWSAYQFYPSLPPSTFAAPTVSIPSDQE